MPSNFSAEQFDPGSYLRRDGHRVAVEKVEDRFTVLPSSPEQLERVRSAPGVRDVKRVTKGVCKFESTSTERDAAIPAVRSDGIHAVAHHASRPKDTEGSIYYLTDRIIARFRPEATPRGAPGGFTNFHAFKRRERMEVSKVGRALLKGRGDDTLETEEQMLQRVMPELMSMKRIVVLNGEAHHCCRKKVGTHEEHDL